MFQGGPGSCEGTSRPGSGLKRSRSGLGWGGQLGLAQSRLLDELLGVRSQVTDCRETFLGKHLYVMRWTPHQTDRPAVRKLTLWTKEKKKRAVGVKMDPQTVAEQCNLWGHSATALFNQRGLLITMECFLYFVFVLALVPICRPAAGFCCSAYAHP